MRPCVLVGSLLALAVIGATTATGCGPDNTFGDGCTLVACDSTTSVSFGAQLLPKQVENGSVTACFNQSCSKGTITIAPSKQNDRLSFELAGSVSVAGYVTALDAVTDPEHATTPFRYRIELIYHLGERATANGDLYKVDFAPANGGTPTNLNEGATYTETRPNGPNCPPTCRSATIAR